MFEKLKNWNKNRKQKIYEQVQEQLKAEEELQKPQLRRVISDEAEKYRDSKEPWVTIIGDNISEDGIQIALDWNDAFVKYLKAQGVTGIDETQIVQHWLAMISRQAADKLSEHYTDLEGKVSEFT